jgi:hypothetical protein
MSTPNPDHKTQASLRDALRRDAARVEEPPFDAALHHSTMRRIRALSASPRPEWKWAFACAVVLVFGASTMLWQTGPPPIALQFTRTEETPFRPTQASALAYQRAAAQSEEAFLAMLERDALTLLPPTPACFTSTLAALTP